MTYQNYPEYNDNGTPGNGIPTYNATQQSYYTAPPAPAPHPEKPRRGRGFAGILCACLVASSITGFGGGYLASSLADKSAPEAAALPSISGAETASLPLAQPEATSGTMSVSQVVNAVSDAVVEIGTTVQTTNIYRQTVTGQAAGSGVIISSDGYIITNNHVIEGASEITVRLKNGDSYPAVLVGTDPQTDVAVVKVEATGLQAAKIGSSSGLQAGDEAIAIGNPLGELGGTVTNGIISATSRDVTIDGETMNLLQTNAAINPGNSGGGLFNNQGELIGIVVAKSAGSGVEGLGFAIPIDTAYDVASELIANGYVTGRGELGVSVLDVSDPQTALLYRLPQMGVYIAGIEDGSSAQKAGLQTGDAILSVNGTEISNSQELKTQLERHKAGDTVPLEILRGSQKLTLPVTLQEATPEVASRSAAV